MRILQVISRLNYGGAAALVAQWSLRLKNLGHDVEVCTIYSGGQFSDVLQLNGIKVHNLGFDKKKETKYHPKHKYDPRIFLPLVNIIRSGRFDIVNAHLFPTSIFVGLTAAIVRKPTYIFTEHNVFNRRRRFGFFKPIDKLIYHNYDRIIAVSPEVCETLLIWLPKLKEKIFIVPNAIETTSYDAISKMQINSVRKDLGINSLERVILYAGRLHKAKGPDVLLDALLHLSKVGITPPIRVLVAGTGPMMNDLMKHAALFTSDVKIDFLGLRTDIPVLLQLADLVILPSRWEGLPMILLEAMAAHKPIIATEVGGIPEVVQHNISAWLVQRENPRAIANGIDLLLNSMSLRNSLGEQAFKTVQNQFSIEVAVDKLLRIYQDALKI